ncbi:hypothetical protein D3C79_876630 [compost metagenome]
MPHLRGLRVNSTFLPSLFSRRWTIAAYPLVFLFWKTITEVPSVIFLTLPTIGLALPPSSGRVVAVVMLMIVEPLTAAISVGISMRLVMLVLLYVMSPSYTKEIRSQQESFWIFPLTCGFESCTLGTLIHKIDCGQRPDLVSVSRLR